MVKIKKGDVVEVVKKYDTFSAWFPAKIISIDGADILVEFKYGEHEMEITRIENIRPCPPNTSKDHRWRIGDTAEVFDNHSWKVGKVVKVLHDNCVIKIYGSIQLKTFHTSRMRVRQVWQNHRWGVIGEEYEYRQACDTPGMKWRYRYPQDVGKEIVAQSETDIGDPENHRLFGTFFPPRKAHRNNKPRSLMASNIYDPISGRFKKLKPMKKSQPGNLSGQGNEDNSECSVASCSSNYIPNCTSQCIQKSPNGEDDAESVCPVEITMNNSKHGQDEFAANVHKLEVHAYQSTVQAFYASGPLSWEQESLLTNLRLSLHISNEEHLLHLRNLLSSSVP